MLNQCFPLYLHHLVLLFVDMVIIHNNQRILSFLFFNLQVVWFRYVLLDFEKCPLWTILVKQDTSCKFSFRIEVSLKLFQVHMFIDWSVLILNQNLFVLGFESEGRYIYNNCIGIKRFITFKHKLSPQIKFYRVAVLKMLYRIKQHARRNVCIKHLNNWSTGTVGS